MNRLWIMIVSVVIMITLLHTSVGDDWATTCSTSCKCMWSQGKKTAECNNATLTTVPGTLSSEVQILHLSGNNLNRLPKSTFADVGLVNLHRIILQRDNIKVIDKNSLSGLKVLIYLDLSYNEVQTLHRDLFRECEKIREIILTHNPIQNLVDGLFHNLQFLTKVDFSYCNLSNIGLNTFNKLPVFNTLELKGNKLINLNEEAFKYLPKLSYIGLNDNPWMCNCSLRTFADWVKNKNLYSIPTSCSEPSRLSGKTWNLVDSEEFACKPEIKSPDDGETINVNQYNVTLECKVYGDPSPRVQWLFNSRIIHNLSTTGSGDQKFIIRELQTQEYKWFNLTLINARLKDSGEYKCVAENLAGLHEISIQLKVDNIQIDSGFFGPTDSIMELWPLIVGVVSGALLLLIVLFVVFCCFCKKEKKKKKRELKNSKENLNGGVSDNMADRERKNLLSSSTVVNPLKKPPRRSDQSVSNSETELHDLTNGSPYNDNGSLLGRGVHDSEEHSVRSYATVSRRGGSGGGGGGGGGEVTDDDSTKCTPDLLMSFPAKSDTGDSVNSDRFPVVRPQHLLQQQFGTLPRSHGQQFSPPHVTRPSGPTSYVTIPRKQRSGSWNATLSPVLVSPDSTPIDPIYDNLGPRTTADGSSVLSLNKCDTATLLTMRNRPLPPTPSDSIAEHTRHSSWNRTPPEGSLTKLYSDRDKLIQGSVNPTYITSSSKINKIPPNPPPKPKKKPGKSFFEDEGEDGTEV